MNTLAVIDIETTGLNPYRYDRVIEIAAVLLLPGKGIQAELTTLVNPERDVGPVRIHGITASDLINAPRFADVASHLVEFLCGSSVLAGHNIRFDVSFLRSEFIRIGIEMPRYETLDTMYLAGGGTLSACCVAQGVKFDGRAHAALHDARATALLLQKMLLRNPDLLNQSVSSNPPTWPTIQTPRGRLLTRKSIETTIPSTPSYIQRLAEQLSVDTTDESQPQGETDYRELLWRALEDGRIVESESESLVEVAKHWGISFDRVKAIHRDYLSRLIKASLGDQFISEAEFREIHLVAHLLGFGTLNNEQLHELAHSPEDGDTTTQAASPLNEDWTGKTVCFTGDCSCSIRGQLVSRDLAEQMAAGKGLVVKVNVTKKLDILVVADPNTQPGKAKKAHQYGIRIVHEPVFWRSLGITLD